MKDDLAIIPVDQLRPSPRNPRARFDDARQQELVASIQAKGLQQPLLVRPLVDEEAFQVIAGHRRLAAAQTLGLAEVPARILEISEEEAFEVALVENLQRADLHPLEEARAFGEITSHPASLDAVQALARRLGKPAGFIWDRIKLLDLVPDASQLLERGTLPVAHAQLLARLTPDQQVAAISPHGEAVFQHDAGFNFSDATDDERDDPWRGLKAQSLGELRRWIDKHCRFDVTQAVVAAPLDFAPIATRVGEALAGTRRGKKYISISYEHQVHPDARAEGERTYCATSWRRADDSAGAPTCAHAILGLVVSGDHRGEAFEVCTASKDCDIHWGKEKREREKLAKQRQANPGAAAQQETAAQKRQQEEREKEEAARGAWKRATPAILEATVKALRKAKPLGLAPLFRHGVDPAMPKAFGPVKTADDLVRYLVLKEIWYDIHDSWSGSKNFPPTAKLLGIDLTAILRNSTQAALDKTLATGGAGAKTAKKAKAAGKKGSRRG